MCCVEIFENSLKLSCWSVQISFLFPDHNLLGYVIKGTLSSALTFDLDQLSHEAADELFACVTAVTKLH